MRAEEIDGRPVEEWIELLSDVSKGNRRLAARTLGKLKERRPEVVAALIECLDDDDPLVCSRSMAALVSIGAIDSAEPTLKRLLASDDRNDRRRAYLTLAHCGGQGAPLAAHALRTSKRCRNELFEVLKFEGPESYGLLIGLLQESSWHVRKWTLDDARFAERSAPPDWVEKVGRLAIGDPSSAVRHAATTALCRLGPSDETVTAQLRRLMRWGDERLRYHVLRETATERFVEFSTSTILPAALRDESAALRAWAAYYCCYAVDPTEAVVHGLRGLLDDKVDAVNGMAAAALELRKQGDARTFALLVRYLKSAHLVGEPFHWESGRQRRNLRAGGGAGAAAPSRSVPMPKPDGLAIQVLLAGGVRTLPHVQEALRNALPGDRLALVNALGHLGEPAVPSLTALLEDESEVVRWAALSGLVGTREGAAIALEKLLAWTSGEWPVFVGESAWERAVGQLVGHLGEHAVLPLLVHFDARLRHLNGNVEADTLDLPDCFDEIRGWIASIGDPARQILTRALDDPELKLAAGILLSE